MAINAVVGLEMLTHAVVLGSRSSDVKAKHHIVLCFAESFLATIRGKLWGPVARPGPENASSPSSFPIRPRSSFFLSPNRYEYHWADGTNIKKPIKCSAPKYIDYLMTWVQDQLDDETLFPSKIGNCSGTTRRASRPGPSHGATRKPLWFFSHLGGLFCCFINTSDHAEACSCFTGVPFPKNFMSVAKTILKRLFRVYAHIYHQHFDSVMRLQEEAHLNTSFKHFIFFVQVRCGTAAQLPLPGLFVPVCF